MPIKLAWTSKSFDKKLTLFLLSLLYQISTAVNDLCFDQPDLIHFAWTLDCLDQGVNQLHSEIAAVAIDELLLVYC